MALCNEYMEWVVTDLTRERLAQMPEFPFIEHLISPTLYRRDARNAEIELDVTLTPEPTGVLTRSARRRREASLQLANDRALGLAPPVERNWTSFRRLDFGAEARRQEEANAVHARAAGAQVGALKWLIGRFAFLQDTSSSL